jgi:ribosome-associated heat shock protein Hsp15
MSGFLELGAIILAAGMRVSDESEGFEGGEGGGESLRVDRWLWCTRMFKSRTLAAEAVGGGKVHVNGRRVKPAQGVRVGDMLTITRPGFQFECRVLSLPRMRGAAPMAQACYEETEAARAAREKFGEQSRLAAAFAPRSLDKPDKHGRRELRRLRGRD